MSNAASESSAPGQLALATTDLTRSELNTRIVRCLVMYFEDRYKDPDAVEAILRAAGLDRVYLENDHNWVSMLYRDKLLSLMTEYSQDPRFAYKAGRFVTHKEAIGIGYSILAGLSNPLYLYEKLIELLPHVNKVGRFEVLEKKRESLTLTYCPVSEEFWDEGPGAEFRVGQLVAWPNLCHLEDANIVTKIVTVAGQRAYHYTISWKNAPRSVWLEVTAGVVFSAMLAVAIVLLLPAKISVWWILPVAIVTGCLLGLLFNTYSALNQLKIHRQQQEDEMSAQANALHQRFEEVTRQNTEIQALNGNLKQLNDTLKQRVDDQTQRLRDLNQVLKGKNQELRTMVTVKSRFLSQVNSDLLNPLNLMLPLVESLLGESKNGETRDDPTFYQRSNVDTIRQHALHLSRKIHHLLDIAKSEDGRLHLRYDKVDISHFVASVLEEIRPRAARHHIDLITDLAEGYPTVIVDMEKMESAIHSILAHCLKSTPPGGALRVWTHATPTAINIGISEASSPVSRGSFSQVLDFTRSPEAETKRKPLVTSGLDWSKEVVELHNGKLEHRADAEQGQTFLITLPQGRGTVREELVERRKSQEPIAVFRRNDDGLVPLDDYITNPIDFRSADAVGGDDEVRFSIEYDLRDAKDLDVDGDVAQARKEGRPNVLVVNDDPSERTFLGLLLQNDYNVVSASSSETAEVMVHRQPVDLIICDLVEREHDSSKRLCQSLKNNRESADIPFILISRERDHGEGLVMGADDLLTRPFNAFEMLARIKANLARRDLVQKLWETNKILEEKRQLIERMAITDALTGLYNRRYLQGISSQEFDRRYAVGERMALIVADIDHFKRFNTLYGHAGGDVVLREVAQLLKDSIPSQGTAARFGGEEFALLLPDTSMAQAAALARTIQHQLIARLPSIAQKLVTHLGAQWLEKLELIETDPVLRRREFILKFDVTLSLGIAAIPECPVSGYDGLFLLADDALYQAKVYRNCVRAADPTTTLSLLSDTSKDATVQVEQAS